MTDSKVEGAWTVHALLGRDGQALLDRQESEARLLFEDGEMRGHTGCNGISGEYTLKGDNNMRFLPATLGSRAQFCADEPPMLSRLLAVRDVNGTRDVLYLHDENGAVVAELRR